MLDQVKPNKSSRWVRLSLAATVLLVVVVCAVAFSSNAPSSLGQKNMVAGVDSEPYDGDYDMTDTVPYGEESAPETDGEEFEDAEPAVEDIQDIEDVDEDVEEDGEMAVENDIPKKVRLCDKLCKHYFRGKKRAACKKDCKDDYGDHSKPRKCFKDCKKACVDLAPPGKIGNCFVKCEKRFCPRPLRFCLRMCRVLGKKQFKKPVRKNIRKCRKDCRMDKCVRDNPQKCHAKCIKTCDKFAKNPKVCKGDCKMLCPAI